MPSLEKDQQNTKKNKQGSGRKKIIELKNKGEKTRRENVLKSFVGKKKERKIKMRKKEMAGKVDA